MQVNLSPSVNILRDEKRASNYIVTANSRNVYEQIATQFKYGVRSFNIVGSYGTGKSAFLLALINHFNGKNAVFGKINGQFNGIKKYVSISIVGEDRSFISVFADILEVEANSKTIFNALKMKRDEANKSQSCFIIVVDEFGKFLEYAMKNNPASELYFLQELAEFFNDPDKNFLFLTTLHQNFDAYAISANSFHRKEWEKVKGRFKELTFNEPVEQLLQLASEFIGKQNWNNKPAFDLDLSDSIANTGAFRFLNDVSKDLAQRLFPFDLMSAMCLTVALQRYGQNERSLFSFLTTDEYLGLNHYNNNNEGNPYFNLASVYDYLIYNYNSVLTSKHNPDFFKWLTVKNTLERVDLDCTEHVEELQKIVKTIGLLEVLASDAAKINIKFLNTYGQKGLGIAEPLLLLKNLESKKIIRYQTFKDRFKLFEGTDENLELLLQKSRESIEEVQDIAPILTSLIEDKYVMAKAVSFKKGTPRVLEYKLTNKPIAEFNDKNHEIDGYINLVLSDEEIDLPLVEVAEPILYGYYRNTQDLRKLIVDIEAVDNALGVVATNQDKVAIEELQQHRTSFITELNEQFNYQLFDSSNRIDWYFNGKLLNIPNKRAFNQALSNICEYIYNGTPQYRNELINRVSFSNNIPYARKTLIEALYDNATKPDFGFEEKAFPPEKTIYYSLFKSTNLIINKGGQIICGPPTGNQSFMKLWEVSIEFLESTKTGKRSLSELIDKLYEKPFRLKDGLVDFWILLFMLGHREEYALFKNGIYVPRVGKDVAELFFREAKNFEIKKFNIQGVKLDLFNKYRAFSSQVAHKEVTNIGFQETAKPFLIFYRELSNYAKQTKSVSQECIAFRKALTTAKDLEKLFFEVLPQCFGTSMEALNKSEEELSTFVGRINQCMSELHLVDEELVNRVETIFSDTFSVEATDLEVLQKNIKKRYATIKEPLLYPRQKTLLNRLRSELPDKKAWFNSVVQVTIGKQLAEITDDEEKLLSYRFEEAVKELDDLLEWSKMDFDTEKEQAITIEIRGSDNLQLKSNILLSKKQSEEAKMLEKQIKKLLKDTKQQIGRAALINLLKKNLQNE